MTEIEQLCDERDELAARILDLKHERNVLQKICAERADEIEQLRAERDELKALLGNSTRAHAATIERERALAAHVERLCRLIDQAAEGEIAPQDIAVLLAGEKPDTSLAQRDARLKAEWQAEALDTALEKLRRCRRDEPTVKALVIAIDEIGALRRQAEKQQ